MSAEFGLSVSDRKCGMGLKGGRGGEEEFLSNDESIIHIQAINLDARSVPPSEGRGIGAGLGQ